ncbi:MAG: patatin-like phospholipase family protein [Nitrosomonas sp.]|nr:patatin-like phospholipase family protein [Nitrosomonas sp.]
MNVDGQGKTCNIPKVGLVLTGGGARAAYQVGVLRAIAGMLPDSTRNPFPVICGTSAGAINATSLAVSANNFYGGVRELEAVWGGFHVNHVYRSDFMGVLSNSLRCLGSLMSDKYGRNKAVSLLDNRPLEALLRHRFPFRAIHRCVQSGALHALGLTAWGYTSGQSVTFYQAAKSVRPWKRAQRVGVAARIGVKHLMASSSIPFVFPAVKLNREYFGDGSMRQMAPISPALHLGAEKILVIGVHTQASVVPKRVSVSSYPPFAQIAGHAMNSIFVDSLDVDLERLQRINGTLKMIPPGTLKENNISLRPIESMMISPSEEINDIALQYADTLPLTMRLLCHGIGAMGPNGSTLLSYILFEERFCKALIKLGYNDTLQQRNEILQFIGVA